MKKLLIILVMVFFVSESGADFRVLEQIRSKASARARSNALKNKKYKKAIQVKKHAAKHKKKIVVAKPNPAKERPKERVTSEQLEIRDNIAYLPNEDTPFTGKHLEYHPNGKKYIEIKYKDGKKNGLVIMWDEYEHKVGEINYADGQRVE